MYNYIDQNNKNKNAEPSKKNYWTALWFTYYSTLMLHVNVKHYPRCTVTMIQSREGAAACQLCIQSFRI